jgi:large subunit ribosomal protein L43
MSISLRDQQATRLTLNSSFILHELPKFAKRNPDIEISVSKRPNKHPVIRGHYMNGLERAVCVRNLEHNQILQRAELLRDSDGKKNKRVNKPVASINESVRGIWSPYHGDLHKI